MLLLLKTNSRMNILRVSALLSLLCSSSAKTSQKSSTINRVGLEEQTVKTDQLSDSDLNSLIDSVFNQETTLAPGVRETSETGGKSVTQSPGGSSSSSGNNYPGAQNVPQRPGGSSSSSGNNYTGAQNVPQRPGGSLSSSGNNCPGAKNDPQRPGGSSSSSGNNCPGAQNVPQRPGGSSSSSGNNCPGGPNVPQRPGGSSSSSGNNYPGSQNVPQRPGGSSSSSGNNYPDAQNVPQRPGGSSSSSGNNYPGSQNVPQRPGGSSTSGNNYPGAQNVPQRPGGSLSSSGNNYPGSGAQEGEEGGVSSSGGSNYPGSQDESDYPKGESSTGDSGADCECVEYYQCNENRTVIEDGTGLIDIRMKEGPCEDYMQVCCSRENVLPLSSPITRAPPTQGSGGCGRRNFQGVGSLRITGATDEAQFGEFPWVVAVVKKQLISGGKTASVFQCGGSLIHYRVVLTAAHCVKGQSGLLVRAGEWDTQRSSEPLPTQNRPVREIIIHEQFNAGSLYNDVALLLLEAPMDPALNVAPICLPPQGENINGQQCVASGWGKDVFGKEGKYQVILKKLELPLVGSEACQEALRKTRLGRRFRLHSSFLCAGGEIGKDTCQGDGGGPLMCPSVDDPAVYVQAGIVAWGIGCGTETPGVYVNVPMFRDWIDERLSVYNIDHRVD